MPTYSLTLRSLKGSKLTTQELDNNFLYVLENASGGSGATGQQGLQGTQGYQGPSGGGSVNIDSGQIAFGSLSGLTSSEFFIFQPVSETPILGSSFSGGNLILGAKGPQGNQISGTTSLSVILGGLANQIIDSNSSSEYIPSSSAIVGGIYNRIENHSMFSVIGGGIANNIHNSISSTIIGGYNNKIYYSQYSSIIGGRNNNLKFYSNRSSIIGGGFNTLCCSSSYSSLIGGCCNLINYYSCYSSIIGGKFNQLGTQSCNSVILGGNGLSLVNQCNTALTQHLWIAGSVSPNNGGDFGVNGNFSGFTSLCIVNGIVVSVS